MNIENRAASSSLVLLATIAVSYVLVVGKGFLVPLAVALMIWYVINAMSRNFVRFIPGIEQPNWITMTLAVLGIGLFMALTISMIQDNIFDVRAAVPKYRDNFAALSGKLSGVLPTGMVELLPNFSDVIKGINLGPILTGLTDTILAAIGNITLVLIYVAFMLAEQGTFKKKIREIFPEQRERDSVMSILSHAQEDIEKYLWIKTITSALTGTVSYFVLLWVGVDFAIFWAFTIFMLNFIPTVGSIIATLFPAILALIQFDTFGPFLMVLLGVGAIQVVVGNVLEPRLMGNSLNVSPLVVMLSLTLWGGIWGISGALLSVPITVILMIIFAHFDSTRYIAIMLSGDGSLKFAQDTKDALEEGSKELTTSKASNEADT